jgi:hypothetical protein
MMSEEMMRFDHPVQIEDIVEYLTQTIQVKGTVRVVFALVHHVLNVRVTLQHHTVRQIVTFRRTHFINR